MRHLILVAIACAALEGCASSNLVVIKIGPGGPSGMVTSNDGNIACGTGSQCAHSYPDTANVSLSPGAVVGPTFGGWAGDCAGGTTATCQLSMGTARTVFAAFYNAPLPPQASIRITPNGNGTGTVTSAPAQIAPCATGFCGTFVPGQPVVLEAAANEGSQFRSWNGCDAEFNRKCVVATGGAEREIAVRFSAMARLTVNIDATPSGGGSVDSVSVADIHCPTLCAHSYDSESGAVVRLRAVPNQGSVFGSWMNCTPVADTPEECDVTMSSGHNVTADFVGDFKLTINREGGGSVRAGDATDPAGNLLNPPIDCGDRCEATFPSGRHLVVKAFPSFPNVASFEGCASVIGFTCFLDLGTSDRTVTVKFRAP